MSSQPTGWQTPKTNWKSADVPLPTDLNRIEGNIQAIESGSRTLDPSQVPSGNSGSLRQILSWFANRIRAITGASNWYDSPATTLAAAKSHIDATSGIHGATSSATANRLIIRDSNGRASVVDPTSSSHIATKGYVDGTVSSHANATSVHGATSSATANRIIIRDSAGRAKVAAPSASDDIARKAEVDAVSSALNTHKSSGDHDGRYYRKNEWARSAGGAGYVKLPNGMILQWGLSPSVGPDANTSATFPIAFPTACLRVIAVKENSTTNDDDNWAVVRGFSRTGADFRMEHVSIGSVAGPRYAAYLAIGY